MTYIDRNAIYDKNINFLLGSGASYGLLPTLSLKIQNSENAESHTLETLATIYEDNLTIRCHLFSWYLKNIIEPAAVFEMKNEPDLTLTEQKVIDNYRIFIRSVLSLMSRKGSRKRVNIFTTNYDGMIIHAAEDLLNRRTHDFIINDGAAGFNRRILHSKNFGRLTRDVGSFGRHAIDIPQMNIVQLHGSVYWHKANSHVEVSYDIQRSRSRIDLVPQFANSEFDSALLDSTKTETDLQNVSFTSSEEVYEEFWTEYKKLPIVNPTKWKFHETVFEEHYYEMLRLMSYTLEEPDTVFIIFGFSFADEHILNLFRRSLSNPTLKVFVCCFDNRDLLNFEKMFSEFPNVELVANDSLIDFSMFNSEIFSPDCASGSAP